MSKTYQKTCDYCKQTIEMSDKSGKWLPYNLNNGPHDCRNGINNKDKQVTLEQVQKKLADIGIIINVERLMRQ